MLTIQGVYDGVSVIPKETIPFRDEYEVIITFLKPRKEKQISSFASEKEMINYLSNIAPTHIPAAGNVPALAMASENALAKDWLLPEEDDAWGFL